MSKMPDEAKITPQTSWKSAVCIGLFAVGATLTVSGVLLLMAFSPDPWIGELVPIGLVLVLVSYRV